MTANEKFPPLTRILVNILLILLIPTVLSIILAFIIKGTVGTEVFAEVLFFPSDINSTYPFNLLGLLVLLLGFVFVIAGNFHLLMIGRIGLQAREPFHIPSTLVTTGPYRYSRNPIYLGVVLILLGLAVIFASITVLICTVVLFLFFWRFFVGWEEKKLEEAFGEEYLLYKKRVRRWL
ncbi:MAG: methyltransferase family protein [Candidatus Odinarchaeota archaeon]